jgi:hypothetical protein
MREMRGRYVTTVADRESDRDHLLDRLQNLRTIVPVFAEELATARRQAARLRLENGRLREQVRRLQPRHVDRFADGGSELAPSATSRITSIYT